MNTGVRVVVLHCSYHRPGRLPRYCNIPLKRLLYPVPDLETNVLGVHYTVTVDGKVKIGPTATPGFWRENYVREGGGAVHGCFARVCARVHTRLNHICGRTRVRSSSGWV